MVLCGCSLGAILALDYAWRHPRRVSALVLIAPRVRMPWGLLRLQNGVFRLLPARAFAGQGMGKDQVLSLTRSMLALDLTPALDAVCQPTLVLCGEKDRVNQSAAREIARRLPHGRYEQAAGAGHAVNKDRPGAVVRALQTVAMMKPPV